MTKQKIDEDLRVTLDVNVLVIGGGFAGAWAALRAAERVGGVMLIDKAYVSRSGASTSSGGVTTAPQPDDDLEKWVEELAVFGGYQSDQDWTRALLNDHIERVAELDGWGVPIIRDDEGKIARIKSRGMVHVRALQYSPPAAMERLRLEAVNAGAKIFDKITIVNLLTSDGQYPTTGSVVGAVGFDVRDGTFYVIRAKRVILATGPLAMKGFHPIDNDTGDGFAMGHRVGAKMLDMEFGVSGTFSFVWGKFHMGNYNVAVGHGAQLINSLGERFMERYDPVRFERSELNRVVAAYLKELIDGRGPVYIDLTKTDDTYWSALASARGGRLSVLLAGEIPDPKVHPVPIEPGWTFWNGGKGGLFADLECRTDVPGLFAAGGVMRNSAVGRHGSAGTPTAHAMVSGARAGVAAASDALVSDMPEIDWDQVERLRQDALRPMTAEGTTISADAMHQELCDVMGSPLDIMIQNEGKIDRSLALLDDLRLKWNEGRVADVHELVKYHEAVMMLEAMELTYHCMRDRTESRESFYREDYPLTDDDNWLCWHTSKMTPEGLAFDRQEIPFERYAYKPAKRGTKLSTIAAIMQGDFSPSNYEDIYADASK